MVTIGLIIALIVDRAFPSLERYRIHHRLASYCRSMMGYWRFGAYPWFALVFVALPLLVSIAILEAVFDIAIFGIFALGFYVLIFYLCFGPRNLDRDVDSYIAALATNDSGHVNAVGSRLFGSNTGSNQLERHRQVAGTIFVFANRYIFSVIFWLVLFGPIGAVGYRLVERLASEPDLPLNQEVRDAAHRLLTWMEWVPAMLTSLGFMVCGNFEAGLSHFGADQSQINSMSASNELRLRQVGLASVNGDNQTLDPLLLIKRSRGLTLRTLLVWVGYAFLFDYWI